MHRLMAALAVALWLAAPAAAADIAAQAIEAFGLAGTWSPDCAGPIRVTYAVRPGSVPTATAVIDGTEQAITEIEDAVLLGPNQIKWTAIYRKWSPLDLPRQAWMPDPGETWETILEKVDGKIRSLQSQRQDGQKVLARDGFYYVADEKQAGVPLVWRKTDQPTRFFARCNTAARLGTGRFGA